jgi:hypothetical protein
MMVYLFQFIVMHLDNINMQGEREINIKSNPKLWIYNVEGIHQLRINETFIYFFDKHVNNNKICNGC